MKKKIALLLCLALFAALFGGCGQASAEQAGERTQEAAAGEEPWREAYRAVLREEAPRWQEYTGQYVLYDLDGDDVPELIEKSGTCEADTQYSLYRFDGERAALVVHFGGGNSSLCGLAEERALLIHRGHMGCEQVYRLRYDGRLAVQDRPVSEREMDGQDESWEYLPLEPLELKELTDQSGLSWTENPPDGNGAVLKPFRLEQPVLSAYVLFRQFLGDLSLPEDARLTLYDLDGDGCNELCCQYEQGAQAVTEIWGIRDLRPERLFRESFPLTEAADAGLRTVVWRDEEVPVYWTGNGEEKEDGVFRSWRDFRMLSVPDYSTVRLMRADFLNGELQSFSVEDSVFERESYERLMNSGADLLRFQNRYGEQADDWGMSIQTFTGDA